MRRKDRFRLWPIGADWRDIWGGDFVAFEKNKKILEESASCQLNAYVGKSCALLVVCVVLPGCAGIGRPRSGALNFPAQLETCSVLRAYIYVH